MNVTVSRLVLAAKQHEIDELRQLAAKARFVGVVGHLIHALQKERGASSVFLASAGQRFASIRDELSAHSAPLEEELRRHFADFVQHPDAADAKLLSLMAWALLGLEALPDLRRQVSAHALQAEEAVQAFSRIIAGLIALIFEVADTAINPDISRLLVSLFHFVQAKELAGQERAVGALSFASGRCSAAHQQRAHHLIDAQERSFQVFGEFADDTAREQWAALENSTNMAQLERIRRILLSARPGDPLDADLSDRWFNCCSDRLASMWSLQYGLVERLEAHCAGLIEEAEHNLSDSEGLLHALRENPPAGAGMAERLGELPPSDAPLSPGHAMIAMLQAQSARLASMEDELEKARRALKERKTIERAKGVLMARLGLTEEAAYKMLRKSSMDQNRCMQDVAEATLSLADLLAPQEKPHPQGSAPSQHGPDRGTLKPRRGHD